MKSWGGMRKEEDVQHSSFDPFLCVASNVVHTEVTLIYNHPHARAQQQRRVPASKSSTKENKG